MIADGWTGFFLFLLLVAPGLVYDLRVRRFRVPWKESSFTEVSRVALSSLAFSAVGAALAVVAWRLVPALRFDYERFALEEAFRVTHTPNLVILVVGSTLVACGAAWLYADREQRRGSKNKIQTPDLTSDPPWLTAFRTMAPAGNTPYVKVQLVDGTSWLGWVANYTAQYEDSRGLILAGPLAYRSGKDAVSKDLPRQWSRVVIEANQISSIAVQYLIRPADADSLDVESRQANTPTS